MLVMGAHTEPPAVLLHNVREGKREEEDARGAGGGGRENFKGRMRERKRNDRKWRWRRRQPRNGARTHQVVCKAECLQLRKGSYGVGWR